MKKYFPTVFPWAISIAMLLSLYMDVYFDLWKWVLALVGVGLVAVIMLFIKRQKIEERKDKVSRLLKEQAEQAVLPELENVKGNSLKKQMVKRRLVREYLEQRTDYFSRTNGAVGKVDAWLSSIGYSMFFVLIPLLWAIALAIFFGVIWVLTTALGFCDYLAICGITSVLAAIVLIWKRNYVLSPIALVLAFASVYGIYRLGFNGVGVAVSGMIEDMERFRYASHAESVMHYSMVLLSITGITLLLYSWLKKKSLLLWLIICSVAIFLIRYETRLLFEDGYHYMPLVQEFYYIYLVTMADFSVMLNVSPSCAFVILFIYIVPLMSVIYTLPAFVRAYKGVAELGMDSSRQSEYKKIYYICVGWLIINLLAAVLAWAHIIGLPVEQGVEMLDNELMAISNSIGIDSGYSAFSIFYCLPPVCSALISWILYTITKRQIKLGENYAD